MYRKASLRDQERKRSYIFPRIRKNSIIFDCPKIYENYFFFVPLYVWKGRHCDGVYWGDCVTRPRGEGSRQGLLFAHFFVPLFHWRIQIQAGLTEPSLACSFLPAGIIYWYYKDKKIMQRLSWNTNKKGYDAFRKMNLSNQIQLQRTCLSSSYLHVVPWRREPFEEKDATGSHLDGDQGHQHPARRVERLQEGRRRDDPSPLRNQNCDPSLKERHGEVDHLKIV